MKKLKKEKGFTLIELIVVIAMLAILASVSIGGFEYSQKRAAIENDKALVKQLNQVLDSYSIFTHNEGAIHDALIEEFGDTIEIQSLKFGYDIYCYKDLCEFYLLDKDVYEDNDNYLNLWHYLNFSSDNSSSTQQNSAEYIFYQNKPYQVLNIYLNPSNLDDNRTMYPELSLSNVGNSTTIKCESQAVVKYGNDKFSDDFEIDNKNNTIRFYKPGVYLITNTSNNKNDCYLIYVKNQFIVESSTADLGIKPYGLDSTNAVKCQTKITDSEITVEVSNFYEGLTITDYLLQDGTFSTQLARATNLTENIIIIAEYNGNYQSIQMDSRSDTDKYIFTFDLDAESTSNTVNITFRYFANDGIWHYSDEIEIDINREN